MATELETRRPDHKLEDGDHDRFAHHVRKSDLMAAYVEGVPIRALCGKVWVPSRDPEKFPLCPTCEEIMEHIRSHHQ